MKLPKKINSLDQKEKKKNLELTILNIDKEINESKCRLREIQTGKK